MKRIYLYFCLCLGCVVFFNACSLPVDTKKTLSTPAPQESISSTPQQTTDYKNMNWWREANDTAVSFSWGYDVYRPDLEMGVYREKGNLVRSTVYNGGKLTLGVSIRLEREETKPLSYGIMVLVDGLPIRFTPDREKEAVYMHPFPVTKEAFQEFTLIPQFTSTKGRIDIIIATNLMNVTGSSAVIPVYVENKSNQYTTESNPIKASALPANFQSPPQKGDDEISWWLWPQSFDEMKRSGQSAMQMLKLASDGRDWLFESATGLSGKLRTVFFLDYQPFTVLNGKAFVDWSPVDGEMLSLPIKFSEIDYPSMLMSFTTRMDDTDMEYNSFVFHRVLVTP